MRGAAGADASGRELGLLWGTVAVALLALAPFGERLVAGLAACPLKTFAGLPCLGCGTARAALALARFDVGGAFAVNPLAAAGWVLLVAGGLVAGAAAVAGRPLVAPEWLRVPSLRLRLAGAAAAVAGWAYLVATGA